MESFDKEYFELDVESKELVIEGLVGKLQSLVSVYDKTDDLQLYLLQLLSVISNEDSPIGIVLFCYLCSSLFSYGHYNSEECDKLSLSLSLSIS